MKMTSKLDVLNDALWCKPRTRDQLKIIENAAQSYAALAQLAALREEPQSVKAVREGFRLLKTLDEGCHGSVGVLLDYIDSLNLAAAQTTEKLNDGT